MTLSRWENFGDLASVRDLFSRVLDDGPWARAGRGGNGGPRAFPVDIYEKDEEVIVRASLPGVPEEQVDVTIEQGMLTIRARRPQDPSDAGIRYLHRELWDGDYARSVMLPAGLQSDKAKAEYEDGILILSIPKAEAARPRQIKVVARGK